MLTRDILWPQLSSLASYAWRHRLLQHMLFAQWSCVLGTSTSLYSTLFWVDLVVQ